MASLIGETEQNPAPSPPSRLDREVAASRVRLPPSLGSVRTPSGQRGTAKPARPREAAENACRQSISSSTTAAWPPVTRRRRRRSRLPAEARRLRPRLHDDPEEAELGAPQGLPRAPHQRDGSHLVHPGRGAQPPGALGRPHPRRPRRRTSRAFATTSSAARSTRRAPSARRSTNKVNRNRKRSKYGVKRPKA